MKKTSERSMKQRRAATKASGPIRWDEIPHQEICARALEGMSFGSRTRASEDSLKHVLKRRLYRLDPADHLRYIELECARIVETLRLVRDEYRVYLEERGCAPLAEMYWVVLRCGVMDWAVMLLRSAAFKYIGHCRLKTNIWDGLFNVLGPFNNLYPKEGESTSAPSFVKSDEGLIKTIKALLPQGVFDLVLTGGPFGRDAQFDFAMGEPKPTFVLGLETFLDAVRRHARRRQALWDNGYPWTEGLARMFDAAQEEISSQWEALGKDARQAEAQFIKLSPLQKIAYKPWRSPKSGHTLSLQNRP